MTLQPTVSPYPTTSPWPSLTAYPTASATPTISPFPTGTPAPSQSLAESPAEQGNDVDGDDLAFYPTASPSFGNEQVDGQNIIETLQPSSILDVLVEEYIANAHGSGSGPTMSPATTSHDGLSISPYPTASSTPTISPFPTGINFPSSSPWPSFSFYPTASATPTVSPFPTDEDTTVGKTSSLGYGHSCSDFEMGKQQVEEEIVFAYIAEARTVSVEFLNELELHLMDHAASEGLECSPDSALHIYNIRYPDNGAASDAVPCKVSQSRSKACWLLRTKMWITTDRSTTSASRESVLTEMERGLNQGKLLTDTFFDLTFTKYLGPDPTETSSIDSTSPVNGGATSASGNNNALYYTLGAVGLVLACAFLLSALFLRSTKWKNGHADTLEPSDDGSIEITELLSRSRQRLKQGSAHFKGEGKGNRHVDFEDVSPILSQDENETRPTLETHGKTSDSNKGVGILNVSERTSSAQRFYQNRSRPLTTSPSSSVRSKTYQPVKQKYLKPSGSSSTSSQGSRSTTRGSMIEHHLGGSSVERAAERRALKGNGSANFVDTHQQRNMSLGSNIV
jgi:hypothetical protein